MAKKVRTRLVWFLAVLCLVTLMAPAAFADGEQQITTVIPAENATLMFETNGGSPLADVTKPAGTVVPLGGYTTTRTGYNFAGWYGDAALTAPVTSVTLHFNTIVYAKWSAVPSTTNYTLTFVTNGGSPVPPQTLPEGTTVDLTAVTTTRTGYSFAGWYSDAALTIQITGITLDSSKTVYALWKQNGGPTPQPSATPQPTVSPGPTVSPKPSANPTAKPDTPEKPDTPAKPDAPAPTQAPQPAGPTTGDESHLALWALIALLALAAAGGLWYLKKHRS